MSLAYKLAFGDEGEHFIGFKENNDLVIVDNELSGATINFLGAEGYKTGSIITTGTEALTYEPKATKVTLAAIDRGDPSQIFKVVRLWTGRYVFQHNEGCLGFHPDHQHFTMVTCNDTDNVLEVSLNDEFKGFFRWGDPHMS